MTVVAISEGADEVYFVFSSSEGIPFRVETCESFLSVDGCHETGAPNDRIFPNASEVSEMCYSVLGKPV